ncbi:ribosome small subunit-dependent GTPase A [Phenylobacterium sp.]|uniref:ribosome small subunit-dependent GTPase A n=1 Tax=Phenylobacterium sp. TaxID=1871053 RepID=UPI00273193E8|nr:ribosome small subunit-dependent GTPase A [Phenylobacterium sp.]MDP1598587.1 ribosome small subunit-dependent GTPase A [Phenylobacterium sp.]MDP3592992.1 ribosome small subunit-dependent GTPase A [Phenylobacterium sp.]
MAPAGLIQQYGWSDALALEFAPHAAAGHVPGRIVVQQRDGYLVLTDEGEMRAKASGRLLHEAREVGHPGVGDWVALSLNLAQRTSTIHALLPRRTAFVRRAAHLRRPQILAANIDVAFVVTSMNADINPRRIERYLAAAWQSGARPVVVLTKSDLCADPQAQVAQIAALAGDCPVLMVSAREGLGLPALLAQVAPRETCVLIGSSGVGKSTLVNAFLGEDRMQMQAIRVSDDQGRHTTSHRQLVLLPSGALILDTPGIREVGLIDADEGASVVFDDIERLAHDCRFNDCSHTGEPGCAIGAALQDGTLDPARWAHFQKLGSEMAALEEKAERTAKDVERRRLAALQKAYRTSKKDARGGA